MKVFLSHGFDGGELAEILAARLGAAGHEVVDPYAISPGADMVSEITTAIRRADVVVALVTRANPNLMYELGLARGANRSILVASRDTADLPFDLTSVPYVALSGVPTEDAANIERRLEHLKPLRTPQPSGSGTPQDALRAIADQPDLATSISPREFENLVRDYFVDLGLPVRRPSIDGVYDFEFAVDHHGDLQTVVVEIKRTAPNSRVSMDSVLRLAGAVEASRAWRGYLITTSEFTTSARGLADRLPVVLWTLGEVLDAPRARLATP